MLKIDVHVHSCYSDSTGTIKEILKEAQRKGLDGIAITDHKTLEGAYEAIKKQDHLIIIPGEEIKSTQGEVLALGIEKVIPNKLSIIDTIRRIHLQEGLVILPHPTVPFFSSLKEDDMERLPIDGLEVFSAITPLPVLYLKKNLKLALRLGVNIFAGSDSNFPETVGDAYTLIHSDSRELKDVLGAMKLGPTTIEGRPSKLSYKLKMVAGLFVNVLSNPFMNQTFI